MDTVPRLGQVGPPTLRVTFYPAAGTSRAISYATLLERSAVPPPGRLGSRARHDLREAVVAEVRDVVGPRASLQGLLEGALGAAWKPQPARGSYPMLLFDAGLTSGALSFAGLQEHLASHGIVSTALPSLLGVPAEERGFDAASIERKRADLELALDATLAERDTAAGVVLAAWSVGGLSALLLAIRRPEIRGLVSLDSGLGYDYGPPLVRSAPSFRAGVRVPLLHITGTHPNRFPVPKTFEAIGAFGEPPALVAHVAGLDHSSFADPYGPLAAAARAQGSGTPFDRGYACVAGLLREAVRAWGAGQTGLAPRCEGAALRLEELTLPA